MLRRSVLAALVATLIPAPAALAATDIGQTTVAGPVCNMSGTLVAWQTSATHQAPARGVLTKLRTSSGTAGAMLSMKVVRQGAAPAILFTTAPVTVMNAGDVVSVDVRVPVEQGDTLGFWLGNPGICAAPGLAGDGIAGVLASADQPAGPISGMLFSDAGSRLAVGAQWEPDADGDHFGDDTQDDCPTDPSITTGGCRTDAALTAASTPASIELGDVAVIDLSVANPGAGLARGAALTGVLPAGLRPVLVSPHSCAMTRAFSCVLGDFGTGSREAALVVRGTALGTHTVPFGLTTTSADPNPANNLVTVRVRVTSQRCTVPRLKGRTKRSASALLRAAGCRLGATKRKRVNRGKAGRVLSQGTKAGKSVPIGTKVAVTLSRRR